MYRDLACWLVPPLLTVSVYDAQQVKFWDSRKVKKAVWTMDHPLSLNNATFNPTGQYLVTTCQVTDSP